MQGKSLEDAEMTYNKGYWWSKNNKNLQNFEKIFLIQAQNSRKVINAFNNTESTKEKVSLTHLVGWSKDDYNRISKFLFEQLYSVNYVL